MVSEVARNALNTRVESWQGLFLGQGRLEVPHELFLHVLLEQLPTWRTHCTVAERHSTDGSQDLCCCTVLASDHISGASSTHLLVGDVVECYSTCFTEVPTLCAEDVCVKETPSKLMS